MEKLFKEKSQKIRIYLGTEVETDPFEHTVETTMLNPFPIKAIVTDLTASSAQWKMVGIVVDKAKEIIIEKKYRSLLEKSHKIEIDGDFYNGWNVNGRMQIREEGNYCRIYIYIKKS